MQPLLSESSLMKHLMENIRDNIYFMDHEGRIILINNEGAKWLGYDSPDQVIGKTDMDIFTEEHGRAAYEDGQRIIKTGIPILGKEEKETRVDDRETWVSTSKMPLRNDDGQIVGLFGISRDITEHKQSEIRAEALASENQRFRDEMEDDLQMAAELQKTFFPTAYPAFPDAAADGQGAVAFRHLHHSCGAVGGDFCSVRKLSDTQAGIFICDVMGHGVRAALGSAIVRAIVEEISHQEKDPGDFLSRMNRTLIPMLTQGGQFLFATACYMVLDMESGRLTYAVAGHPSPIRVSEGRVDWLEDPGTEADPALAISEDSRYATREQVLLPGDTVFMYTDGIHETVNAEGEEFGNERLLRAVEQYREGSLHRLFTRLVDTSCSFSQAGKLEDDVCLIGFKLNRILNG